MAETITCPTCNGAKSWTTKVGDSKNETTRICATCLGTGKVAKPK